MLRRTKAEVEKELPSKTAVVVKCGQSAWQATIYSQISEQARPPASYTQLLDSRDTFQTGLKMNLTVCNPLLYMRP